MNTGIQSNERFSEYSRMLSGFFNNKTACINLQVLPMTQPKKVPEYVETSVVYALSVVAALLGFFLVWLVFTLSAFYGS
jgi:hypothetical protein